MSGANGSRQRFLTGYRMFFALLTFAAIVTETATLVERETFSPGNFFSYFTIESNVFATAVFLLAAVAGGHGRALIFLRGAATLFMAITGIVFSLLLAGIDDAEFTAVPWDNLVLHYVMPVAVVVDWFIDLPQVRIAFRSALVWLVVPVAYVVYSMIRGPIVDWYPYPFLDPDQHTYVEIAATVVFLLGFAAVLTWVVTRFTERRAPVSAG